MRTLAITQNITLDGSIEMLTGWFDPSAQTDDLTAELMRQTEMEEYVVLGRDSFEQMRGYWPQQTDDETGVADSLNRVHKLVVSSSMVDPQWENSTVLGSDWLDAIRGLKQGEGGDIILTGSISLCPLVIQAGLVDEYRLFVYPAVQGRGRRLFPEGHEATLRLLETKAFANGVTLLRYVV